MRIWCLTLCLSLISGLFHASAMPLENLTTSTPVSIAAESHTACHEAQDTSHPTSCHVSGHLCCLGFTTLASQTPQAALRLYHMWNPVFQTLLLQEHPKKQFKPPKRPLQI
jgi:hypothetical protein